MAVYLWHCTREGGYSMYSDGIAGDNCLRGVQEADSQGNISFTTIVPGCHDGRMPHVHFGVYPGMAKAAREEGFDEIADWFETLAKAEKSHAGRFQKALDGL